MCQLFAPLILEKIVNDCKLMGQFPFKKVISNHQPDIRFRRFPHKIFQTEEDDGNVVHHLRHVEAPGLRLHVLHHRDVRVAK